MLSWRTTCNESYLYAVANDAEELQTGSLEQVLCFGVSSDQQSQTHATESWSKAKVRGIGKVKKKMSAQTWVTAPAPAQTTQIGFTFVGIFLAYCTPA